MTTSNKDQNKPTRESVAAWANRRLTGSDAPTPEGGSPWQDDGTAPTPTPTRPASTRERYERPAGAAVVPLPESHLACLSCGQAVDMDRDDAPAVVRLTMYGREQSPESTPLEQHFAGRIQGERDLEFVRCTDCTDLENLAELVIDAHPAVGWAIGSRSIAVEQVETALAALSALGYAQRAPRLTKTDADLRRLLRLLSHAGSYARWAARLVPVARWNADPTTCSAGRWSHLEYDPDRALDLRQAFAQLLREVTEQPTPLPCPSGGCTLCGVGTVAGLASRSDDLWIALGDGAGHSCPTCWPAIVYAGVVGPTAGERALFEFLKVPVNRRSEFEAAVTRWGSLPGNPAPNERPWLHLGDLTELARDLGVTA